MQNVVQEKVSAFSPTLFYVHDPILISEISQQCEEKKRPNLTANVNFFYLSLWQSLLECFSKISDSLLHSPSNTFQMWGYDSQLQISLT
jgi:hypothetical protein